MENEDLFGDKQLENEIKEQIAQDIRKAWYFQGIFEYINSEYQHDGLPLQLNREMCDYLNDCYENLICYPNAAGKFVEMFRIVEKN